MNNKLIEKLLMMLLEWETNNTEKVVQDKQLLNEDLYWKWVIIRWYWSGVHFGKLIKRTEEDWVILENSRRLYRFWCKESITLTDVSLNWLSTTNESKICATVPLIAITDKRIEEIIPCSETAIKSIQEYKVAEQD